MTTPESTTLRDKPFVVLLIAVTAAFGWILWPFFGAIFWAVVLAVLFTPVNRRIERRMGQRPSLSAIMTLAIILVMVILPSALIAATLLKEAYGVYARFESGELDFARYFKRVLDVLPAWATDMLDTLGLTTLGAVQEKLSQGLAKGVQVVAGQALNVGQNTLDLVVGFFIMLYLLFFLLRDGADLARRARRAIPLPETLQRNLFGKFANVVRATMKGTIVVAIVQGALGGLIFWILGVHAPVLWGVVMGFLSLLPAVGTALIWAPVAGYLLVSGSVWLGIVLIAYGVLVIGLVDNLLRPILVGKDTRMPDYVVLIATLGGMAVFGLNGFVIGPVIAALFIAAWDVVAASKAGAQRD